MSRAWRNACIAQSLQTDESYELFPCLQLLERAASRAMEASQHFERAASKCLDDLDRSMTGRNSLDLAINQVLAGMGASGVSPAPGPSPPKSPAMRRSRFQMQAAAAT
jgi:hypothetical protein